MIAYEKGLFAGYCYGPVDLLSAEQGEDSMQLLLRNQTGRLATALYEGCVYWRLGSRQQGIHLSLVQRVFREDLLEHPGSETMRELKKNSENVPELLWEWEREGLRFYLHYGPNPGSEYLVAARKLTYREIG